MKLNEIRAFVAVAETGSIQAAADRIGLTQSAMTRLIQRLEVELGVALFDRHKKPIDLSRDGRLALAPAKRVLRSVADFADAVSPDAAPSGPLRVGLSHAVISTILSALQSPSLADFPGIRPMFRAGWTRELLGLVAAGDLDAAVVLLDTGRPPPGTVSAVPLAADRIDILGAVSSDGPIDITALNAQGWILNPEGCGYRAALEACLAARNEEPNIIVEANSIELQLALAAKGLGYVLVPSAFTRSLPDRNRVHRVAVSGFDLNVTIWWARSPDSGRLGPVLDALESRLRGTITTTF